MSAVAFGSERLAHPILRRSALELAAALAAAERQKGHAAVRGGRGRLWGQFAGKRIFNLSPRELEDVAARAGWRLARRVDGEPPEYYAILDKTG